MENQITLKSDTELTTVKNRHGREIMLIDESFWPELWAYENSELGGLTAVGQGRDYQSVYDAIIDQLEPIEQEDVPEAYDCENQAELDAILATGDYPKLGEGYELQSNATGTGIVRVGYHEYLGPLTLDYVKRNGLRLTISQMD